MAPMTTPRERARERTRAEIRVIAWRHLEAEGAAALSLRAIARELGVVSSAIYRYVASRDELLTQLIVEGYDELAAHAEAADVAVRHDGAGSPRERWVAVGRGVREWALARPAAWALLYGSPVPGYHAPPERTTDAGTRVLVLLAGIVHDAVAVGQWHAPAEVALELVPGLRAAAEEIGFPADASVVAATAVGWTLLTAAVTAELFEFLGPDVFGSPAAWTEHLIERSADEAGLVR